MKISTSPSGVPVAGKSAYQRPSDVLAEKTRKYWVLQMHWNGRKVEGSKMPTVQDALVECNDIVKNLGPKRKLSAKTFSFMEAVINKPEKEAKSKA